MRAADLLAAPGFLLQFVDASGSVGLVERVVELFARLFGQSLEIRLLRAGHRLFAGRPIVGVFDRIRVVRAVDFVVVFVFFGSHNLDFFSVNETKQDQCQILRFVGKFLDNLGEISHYASRKKAKNGPKKHKESEGK